MDEVTMATAHDKARDIVNYLRKKEANHYDWNMIMEFAGWWVDQNETHRQWREECLRLATKHSPSGTDESAIIKKANTYYNFIINNSNN